MIILNNYYLVFCLVFSFLKAYLKLSPQSI